MISKSVVEVLGREERGKNEARRLRAGGKIPAIVYGMGKDSFAVAVEPRNIEMILRTETGRNTIFKLSLGAETRTETRRDAEGPAAGPGNRAAGARRFRPGRPGAKGHRGRADPLIGGPEGVKNEGGIMEFITRSVQVECLPNEIPDALDLDVTELHVGPERLRQRPYAGRGGDPADPGRHHRHDVAHQRAAEVEEAVEGEEGEVAEGEAPKAKRLPRGARRRKSPPIKNEDRPGTGESGGGLRRHPAQHRVHGADRLAAQTGARFPETPSPEWRAWAVEIPDDGAVLAKPSTFMNRSGGAAALLAAGYQAEAAEFIVVYDDADLAFGRMRIRPGGGAGGHNGVQSLVEMLGTDRFPRVRLRCTGNRPRD